MSILRLSIIPYRISPERQQARETEDRALASSLETTLRPRAFRRQKTRAGIRVGGDERRASAGNWF